jgi:catechol 2,3-dioxygenase-like lactoylglutathione lyase family enzyme
MKRFHVHVAVNNLEESLVFYGRLFGREPSKQLADYAKWMLDDPPVNFAISARGHKAGINHLGIQVDSSNELAELAGRAAQANPEVALEQTAARCCYAVSDKHWTVDPQGLAWEHFQTLADAPTFGDEHRTATESACCIPLHAAASEKASAEAPGCCVPLGRGDGAASASADSARAGACCS